MQKKEEALVVPTRDSVLAHKLAAESLADETCGDIRKLSLSLSLSCVVSMPSEASLKASSNPSAMCHLSIKFGLPWSDFG